MAEQFLTLMADLDDEGDYSSGTYRTEVISTTPKEAVACCNGPF